MQTREGEPELERAKEMTVEGNGGIVYDTNPSPQRAPPESICETQFYHNTRNRGKVYNDIMASIGLDSPTSSLEERGREETTTYEQEFGSSLATTPIRNSAANLLTLGKHALTLRQGRIWEFKGRSPLGG
jgi:hypothetical protein